MKLIPPLRRDCDCAVCARSTPTAVVPLATSSSKPSRPKSQRSISKRSKGKATVSVPEVGRDEVQPTTGPSSSPYHPPIATLLPPEILTIIFAFARPAELPPTSHSRHPVPPSWQSFVRLSLIHHSWTGAAQKELGKVILIRSQAQTDRLVEALEAGWVGGPVRELGFEIKETEAGSEEKSEDQEAVVDPSNSQVPSSSLSTILSLCGARLEVLRLRGFGDPAFLTLPISWPQVPLLRIFEYSPIDSSAPPTTASIFGWLLGLPTLKEIIVSANSRAIATLESVHLPALQDALEAVTRAGVAATITVSIVPSAATVSPSPSTAPLSANSDDEKDSKQVGSSHVEETSKYRSLESFTLSSVLLSSPTLLAILATASFGNLTSLSLKSVHIAGPSSITLLILRILAPSLRHFEWEERMVVGPASAMLRDGLTTDQYWSVIQACTALRSLRLFGERVFHGEEGLGTTRWELPESLQELSIGTKDDVEPDNIKWWLDRVLTLLRRNEPPKHEQQEEVADAEKQEAVMVEDVDATTEHETETADQENAEPLPEPSPSTTLKKRRASSSRSFTLRPDAPSSLIEDDPALLSPALRSLVLYTINTAGSLRQDEDLRLAMEDVMDKGVLVTWYEMSVTLLDAMELTRELRKEMFEVKATEEQTDE